MDPLTLTLVPTLFLAGILSSVVGGGAGIITVLVMNLFLDIRISIALTVILMTTLQLAKIIQFWRYAKWDIVGWFISTGIVMSYVGGRLLFSISERIPKVLLAIACMGFIVMRLRRTLPKIPASPVFLMGAGAVNGIVGGLIGNAALVRLPVLLSMGLSKEVLIGTSAFIAFPMNLGKIVAYLPNIVWTETYVLLMILAVPTLLISAWTGRRILNYVSKELFEKLLLGIVFLGAIRLLIT